MLLLLASSSKGDTTVVAKYQTAQKDREKRPQKQEPLRHDLAQRNALVIHNPLCSKDRKKRPSRPKQGAKVIYTSIAQTG